MNIVERIIRKTIGKMLKESEDENDVINNEYDAIGFANKFYTLWKVIEKKYTTTYIYRKNISFSKEKAFALYPNAKFDKNLVGKSHSFTVSVASDGMDGSDFFKYSKENVSVREGQPVEIDRFIVTNAGIKMSKYNKPYYCVRGHDLEQSESYDFVVNCFEKPEVMPRKGDILKVVGKIGFFNDKAGDIYINDATFEKSEGNENETPESEDGRKFKDEPMVLSRIAEPKVNGYGRVERNGFIILSDENGEEFYVETVVSDFRSGSLKRKFDTENMHVGDKYSVSGTVQIKNGFKKLLRVKLVLIEANEEEAATGQGNGQKQVKMMTCLETLRQAGKVVSSKNYQFSLNDMDGFFDYIMSYKEKHNARIEDRRQIRIDDKESLERSFRSKLESDVDYGGYQMWGVKVMIPQTKEEMSYNFTIYFRVDESIERKISNIIKECILRCLEQNK